MAKGGVTQRVAVVGCGRMGRERAAAAVEAGARVAYVRDTQSERSAELARLMGATALPAEAPLPWEELDAVFLCTPPGQRDGILAACIDADVAVFVEKPISIAAADVARLLPRVASRGSVVAVGYMNRHRKSVRQTRQWLDGRQLLGASCHWVGKPYRVPWWSRDEDSGGPINEQATHLVDLARLFGGDVVEVQALGRPTSTSMSLHYASGTTCSLLYSCEATKKAIDFQLFTSSESVRLTGWDFRLDDDHRPVDKSAIFVAETSSFLASVREGRLLEPSCSLAEAVATQRVVDAVRRALASGRTEQVGAA